MGEKPKTWAYYMLAVLKSATSIFPGNLRVIALRYPQSPYKTYIYAVFWFDSKGWYSYDELLK